MTLEELKNKKITITLDKTIVLGEDMGNEILSYLLEDQKEENYSDEELLDMVKNNYYSSISDIEDIVDFEDYNITIS